MNPRLIFRTHYQVDEPAYTELLIKFCTSPVQSSYRETVAQKLAREIGRRRGKSFNEDAAAYAVDLAKDLDLITENHTWTDRGHLVDLIAEIPEASWEQQMVLTIPEKLLHFRVFLEGDGAALMFLSRRLLQIGALGNSETDWNSLATEMFTKLFSDYLAISNNTADRVALRRKINAKDYTGHSGAHKLFIHLQTLYRLGLIERPHPSGSRLYTAPRSVPGMKCGLQILTEEVPDIFALEQLIRTHELIEVAAKVLQIAHAFVAEREVNLPLLVPFYQRVMATGVPLCSLSTLIDSVRIELASKRAKLVPYKTAVRAIETIQKNHPKDVRFHVDRRGQPAFLKISEDVIRGFCEERVPA